MRDASRHHTRKAYDRSDGTQLLVLRRILRQVSRRLALCLLLVDPTESSAARYLARLAYPDAKVKALCFVSLQNGKLNLRRRKAGFNASKQLYPTESAVYLR
jgi:hypothetical protein